jgi:uncharacterized protein DUF1097
MSARAQTFLPLAVVVAVLAFAWSEVALNAQFHWLTDGNLGTPLGLPGNLQPVVWAAFVSWGIFFAAGGDGPAFGKTVAAVVVGSLAALVVFGVGPAIADVPDFWGISLTVGAMALVMLALGRLGDWYYAAGALPCFAACFGWWVSTGMDNWAPDGGGVGSGPSSLDTPATAGAGALGGLLSTPWAWALVSAAASLLCGAVLGLLSSALSGALTPRAGTRERRARRAAPPEE